jgi:hypothetical protein
MIKPMDAAWSVLKSNTIPIRPRVMQYATDPKKTMRLEQTGGITRRAREKLMDEYKAKTNHNHPDSFSENESDVMDQDGDGGRDYDSHGGNPDYGPYRQDYNTQIKPFLSGNPSIDRTGTPEEIAERAMMRAQQGEELDTMVDNVSFRNYKFNN